MPELAGRGKGRAKNSDEYYATTPGMALRSCETIRDRVPALLDLVVRKPRLILNPRHVLEPTAGACIWPREMRKVWPGAKIKAIELNPELAAYGRNAGVDVETADILHAKHPVQYDAWSAAHAVVDLYNAENGFHGQDCTAAQRGGAAR